MTEMSSLVGVVEGMDHNGQWVAVLYDVVSGVPLMLEVFCADDDRNPAERLRAFEKAAQEEFGERDLRKIPAPDLFEFQSEWFKEQA